MTTRKFWIDSNKNEARVEGLGVIRYQILDLPGLGQNRLDYQIDYRIVTEVGMDVKDDEILSRDNHTFHFSHNDEVWVGEVR